MRNEAGSSELDGFIRALLILLGIGIGVWAMWQWTDTGKGAGRRTTVSEVTSPGPLPSETPAPTSQVVVTTRDHKHGTTTTTSTFGGPTSKTTTTTGPSINTHSDAITLALLGIALLLLLSGVLWGRLQSISAGGVTVAFRSTASGPRSDALQHEVPCDGRREGQDLRHRTSSEKTLGPGERSSQ